MWLCVHPEQFQNCKGNNLIISRLPTKSCSHYSLLDHLHNFTLQRASNLLACYQFMFMFIDSSWLHWALRPLIFEIKINVGLTSAFSYLALTQCLDLEERHSKLYTKMLRESISRKSFITEHTVIFIKNNTLMLYYFRLHISALHKFTYGKHILAKLEAYYAKQQWTSQIFLDFRDIWVSSDFTSLGNSKCRLISELPTVIVNQLSKVASSSRNHSPDNLAFLREYIHGNFWDTKLWYVLYLRLK